MTLIVSKRKEHARLLAKEIGKSGRASADKSSEVPTETAFVDAQTFRDAFEKDISSANQSIDIFPSYISPPFVRSIKTSLENAIERGINATFTIRKPERQETPKEPQADHNTMEDAIAELKRLGCRIDIRSEAPSGLAIFDSTIVWYGDLPLLAFPGKQDCSLRFCNAEIAHDIVRTQNEQDSTAFADKDDR